MGQGTRVPRPRPGGEPAAAAGAFLPGTRLDARRLAHAAMALDDRQILTVLRVCLACDETQVTWEDVILPALAAIGGHTPRACGGLAAEHLLCSCTSAALTEVWAGFTRPGGQPPVLVCAAAGEQHTLPLHALAASLADAGIGCSVLGADLPGAAIQAAAARLRPAAVFVWSQTPATGDPAALAGLAASGLAGRVIAGGRGWRSAREATGAEHVGALADAVSAVQAALARP